VLGWIEIDRWLDKEVVAMVFVVLMLSGHWSLVCAMGGRRGRVPRSDGSPDSWWPAMWSRSATSCTSAHASAASPVRCRS
jgi:hypothetical protein